MAVWMVAVALYIPIGRLLWPAIVRARAKRVQTGTFGLKC